MTCNTAGEIAATEYGSKAVMLKHWLRSCTIMIWAIKLPLGSVLARIPKSMLSRQAKPDKHAPSTPHVDVKN